MSDAVFLYVTAPDAETAEALARELVEGNLAACANILPGMRSVYRWEGKVERGEEVVMIVKTTTRSAAAARDRLIAAHPYDTPCVAAIPIAADGSNANFLEWIAKKTAGSA